MQSLESQLIVLLGFPSVVYPCSYLSGYLHFSHGWCSRNWRS